MYTLLLVDDEEEVTRIIAKNGKSGTTWDFQ